MTIRDTLEQSIRNSAAYHREYYGMKMIKEETTNLKFIDGILHYRAKTVMERNGNTARILREDWLPIPSETKEVEQ